MKKIISLTLILTMLFSFGVTAFAAEADPVISKENTELVVEAAIGAIIDADEDAVIQAEAALIDAITEDAGLVVTASEVSTSVSEYIFLPYEQVEGIADRIANNATYQVAVIAGGRTTVYIAVDLLDNPELFNLNVFKEAVEKMEKKAKELAIAEGTTENYSLMSYAHIAGELALHMIIKEAAELVGGGSWNSLLDDAYSRVKEATLNIDEDRFPGFLFEFIGNFIRYVIVDIGYMIFKG